MTHRPGHGGVVRRRDLFNYQNDPDYPGAPAVKSAGAINVEPVIKNIYSGLTSPVPSKPTPYVEGESPASKTEARYQLGLGPNNLLSELWYGIKPENTQYGGVSTKNTVRPSQTTAGTTGRTTAGGLTGMTAEEALALAKFNYEKEKDANKLAGLQALQNNFGSGFDELLNMIAEQGKVSEKQTQNVYDTAVKNIGQGYDAARDLGASGYAALNQYLRENPNNPYAGMVAQTGTPADAMSNFLQAYGVSDSPVQAQVQADILQSGQGAANFQNLINTLGAIAQQSDVSRGAESQMAQLAFDTGLGQDRAGYQTQAENAKMQALAALQKAMFESQFSVAQQRNAQAMALAQTIAELGGTAPTNNGGGNDGDGKNKKMPPATSGNNNGFVSTSYDVNQPVPWSANPLENIQLQNLATSQSNAGQTVDPYELLQALNARRGR